MSTVSDSGVPGVGTGILHPKHRNRFRVLFLKTGTEYRALLNKLQEDSLIEELRELSLQVVAADTGSEELTTSGLTHRTNRLIITLEDDITNRAVDAIRTWQQLQSEGRTFDVWVDCMDGNDRVIDRYVFIQCSMEALQHSRWHYGAGSLGNMSMELHMPETYVADEAFENVPALFKAVIASVAKGFRIRFDGVNDLDNRGVAQKLLQLLFVGYDHVYVYNGASE